MPYFVLIALLVPFAMVVLISSIVVAVARRRRGDAVPRGDRPA
jgi:hypothetical protein